MTFREKGDLSKLWNDLDILTSLSRRRIHTVVWPLFIQPDHVTPKLSQVGLRQLGHNLSLYGSGLLLVIQSPSGTSCSKLFWNEYYCDHTLDAKGSVKAMTESDAQVGVVRSKCLKNFTIIPDERC